MLLECADQRHRLWRISDLLVDLQLRRRSGDVQFVGGQYETAGKCDGSDQSLSCVGKLGLCEVVRDVCRESDRVEAPLGQSELEQMPCDRFTRDGLPELERLLREGRAAAEEIRGLSSSLRENPSQLLYQPRQVGVEIPR